MVKALSRLGDLIYSLIIIGLIAGFGWAALQALCLVVEDLSLAREMPLMVAAVALVVLLGCVVVLLEKAFQFVGFSERAWLYKYQPAGKWPAFTGSMVGQIMGVFLIAGALTFLVFPSVSSRVRRCAHRCRSSHCFRSFARATVLLAAV